MESVPGAPLAGPFSPRGSPGASRDAAGAACRDALACQTLVKEGMELEEVSPDLARFLAPALEAAAGGARNEPAAATASVADTSR